MAKLVLEQIYRYKTEESEAETEAGDPNKPYK